MLPGRWEPEVAMRMLVNGKRKDVPEGTSLSSYLEIEGLDPQLVSMELNGRIVEREEWPSTLLNEDDELEILFFMGGGL
ncbi:putative thiamine biosynthesis protein [Leptospirillum ferrooxidans C2-3]|uniref:Putative thiamine biosynthesis protein n=2 Tax=Leptospirillum ferrooxidans TaxID=180 RepID=I0IQ73_LEPFC|nr:putative thiamine biosynthesis protein [Leptospirillum ferrooxidans C2-3]